MHNFRNGDAHDKAQIRNLNSATWLNRSKATAILLLAILPWPLGIIVLKWLGAI